MKHNLFINTYAASNIYHFPVLKFCFSGFIKEKLSY